MEIVTKHLPAPPAPTPQEEPPFLHISPPVEPTDYLHLSSEYHKRAVRLLLTNQAGTLLSFDESSAIVVW